jgi:hypothetical protein
MRAAARIPHDGVVLEEFEGARWLVERLADGTARVTLDRGAAGVVVHGGGRAGVRTRLGVDADSRDRSTLDATVRDLTDVQSAVGEVTR